MKMLVLVPKVTGRVIYAMELLLGQLLGLEFELTVDAEQFDAYEGPKMQYGSQRHGDVPFVKAVDLLFLYKTRIIRNLSQIDS